jgi:CheY-like chemotaxis protein
MPSVLIVDDSELDRRLAGGLLTNTGRYEIAFARDGSEALAQLRTTRPAAVLTDLHMPNRGGLMVIEACRLHHANLPVVLMTGQGSECLAVEALKAGAAGYVAKTNLAERLVDTLDDVLSHANHDQTGRRLLERMVRSEFAYELENQPDLVPPLIEKAEQMLAGLGVCDPVDCLRVGAALKELVRAAMLRGNLELPAEAQWADEQSPLEELQAIARRRSKRPFSERRVQVEFRFESHEARFRVRHQGPRLWTPDMLTTVNDDHLDDSAMRPLVLMRAFCDEVLLDQANEVTLVKRRCDG